MLLSSAMVYKTNIEQWKVTPLCHPEGNRAAERHVGLTEKLMWELLVI
jgi:hypothetical protein